MLSSYSFCQDLMPRPLGHLTWGYLFHHHLSPGHMIHHRLSTFNRHDVFSNKAFKIRNSMFIETDKSHLSVTSLQCLSAFFSSSVQEIICVVHHQTSPSVVASASATDSHFCRITETSAKLPFRTKILECGLIPSTTLASASPDGYLRFM